MPIWLDDQRAAVGLGGRAQVDLLRVSGIHHRSPVILFALGRELSSRFTNERDR